MVMVDDILLLVKLNIEARLAERMRTTSRSGGLGKNLKP